MKEENTNKEKKESKTGKYVYDKKLGKVVKVSDEITGIKKGGKAGDGGHSCGNGCCCG